MEVFLYQVAADTHAGLIGLVDTDRGMQLSLAPPALILSCLCIAGKIQPRMLLFIAVIYGALVAASGTNITILLGQDNSPGMDWVRWYVDYRKFAFLNIVSSVIIIGGCFYFSFKILIKSNNFRLASSIIFYGVLLGSIFNSESENWSIVTSLYEISALEIASSRFSHFVVSSTIIVLIPSSLFSIYAALQLGIYQYIIRVLIAVMLSAVGAYFIYFLFLSLRFWLMVVGALSM